MDIQIYSHTHTHTKNRELFTQLCLSAIQPRPHPFNFPPHSHEAKDLTQKVWPYLYYLISINPYIHAPFSIRLIYI
uniref:Uncharacterized protein n=1 Tax=Anguilla anguilla TaxID=7936 RepID=A0A0E9TX04_ANGAN